MEQKEINAEASTAEMPTSEASAEQGDLAQNTTETVKENAATVTENAAADKAKESVTSNDIDIFDDSDSLKNISSNLSILSDTKQKRRSSKSGSTTSVISAGGKTSSPISKDSDGNKKSESKKLKHGSKISFSQEAIAKTGKGKEKNKTKIEDEIENYDNEVSKEVIFLDVEKTDEEQDELLVPTFLNFGDIEDTDVEDTSSLSEDDNELVSELPFSNFLELVVVPDIADALSEDSDDDEKKVTSVKRAGRGRDEGFFADPITGAQIDSSESESPDEEPEIIEEETISEDNSFDLPQSDPELHELPPPIQDDETFQKIFYIELPKEEEEEDVEALAYARELEVMGEGILEYLHLLIGKVVSFATYKDPVIVLRQYLDKKRLMDLLIKKSMLYDDEEFLCETLNRIVCDYYRRKKMMRPFEQETNEDIKLRDNAKLTEATWEVDRLLRIHILKEERTKEHLEQITTEKNAFQEIVDNNVDNLESFIIKTIGAGKSEKFQKDIFNQLEKMQSMRNTVSKARIELIKKNHNIQMLRTKVSKLESLSDELSLTNFISLQTQVTSISKKIEERNVELERARARFNANLHIGSHSREQELMVVKELMKETQKYRQFYGEQLYYKEKIHQYKMRRQELRKNLEDTSFSGGLLCNMELLFDYDDLYEKKNEAIDRVKKLNDRLENLAEKREQIEKLIVSMEEDLQI